MAFQFPDPAVATTVVNEATGITYQWQDPPGKWVIAVETLDTYCVVQQTSTLQSNADSQIEFYTDFEITGDKILTTTVNEQVDYIVSYEGIEERVSNLSDVEKQKIGFVEISKGKYISQSAPDASLVGGVTLKQVITMFDIASDEYECISPERILFGPAGTLAPQGTISQQLECCHKFIASPKVESPDRPPIISDTEPTEHPNFPDEPLQEGDFWIDNHDGRAFTPLYYWTGAEWEELEHDENFDEQLKEHTCAQFYRSAYEYSAVGAKEGHFCSWADFGSGKIKYWTGPSGKDFFHNGDKIYIDDNGPFEIYDVVDAAKWTTFFINNGYKFEKTTTVVVKFSKTPKLCDTSYNDDRYVKKTGDTMTGTLVMQDAELDFLVTGESLKDNNGDPVLDAGGDEQWDSSIDRFSHIESVAPTILKSDGTFGTDLSAAFGIRVEIDDGNTYRNRFVVGNRNGDAVTITGGTGPNIEFGTGFGGNQDPATGDSHWVAGQAGGVKITGIPTPTKENPEFRLAVNKRYVDERDEELRQEIIELEEEIDAIAPSVERGKWRFTAVGTVANPGQFTMYDDAFGSGQPTGLFKSAKSIWFNAVDTDGVAHAFGDVDDGELLEIFVEGSPEYGLYEVVGQAHDETLGATSFWVIDVNFVRTNEDTTAVAPNEVCRFKVFMAPEGGTADGFVLKTGDTMEGPSPLVFKTKETSSNYNNPPANTSYLKFLNDKNGSITSGSLWFGGNNNILTTDLGLMVRGAIYTKEYYYAYGSSSTSSPRMRLQSSTGSLQSGSTVALSWDSTGVKKIRAKDSEGSSGYVLRLDSSKVPYWSSPPMPTYTITKSNGNYYVQ